ncbi:MAG: hypothetical protein Q9207_007574 [Kuettlingeria erythrocarpa]
MSKNPIPTLDTSQLSTDFERIAEYCKSVRELPALLGERTLLLDQQIRLGNHFTDPHLLHFERGIKDLAIKTQSWIRHVENHYFDVAAQFHGSSE